jgi:hypothetical protein
LVVPRNAGVKLYGFTGAFVRELAVVQGKVTVGTENLDKGIYFIKDDAGSLMQKVVVLK